MYVSVIELRDAVGSQELCDLATPDGQRAIDGGKLDAFLASTLAVGDPDYTACQAIVATVTLDLANCASYVDGYLTRYSPLPIADAYVPALIKSIVIALTRYALANDAPSKTVTDRYKDAKADLVNIANGTILLGFAPGSTTTLTGDVADVTPGEDAIYTRTSTQRFQNPCGLLP